MGHPVRWPVLAIALANCDRYLCDDVDGAERGAEIVREVYDWPGVVDVICRPLDEAQQSCWTDADTLQGCAPFAGRAIVVDGYDVCRVVVHEGAHWLDMDCPHEAPCWPTDLEAEGKSLCGDA